MSSYVCRVLSPLKILVFTLLLLPWLCSAMPAAWSMKVHAIVSSKNIADVSEAALSALQSKADAAMRQLEARRLVQIKEFAEDQWQDTFPQRYLRTRVNMKEGDLPQFIVFFAHGYRPKAPGLGYAGARFRDLMAPFLKGFRYVVFHPSLSVGPAVTTFAQDHDIFQVKYHLDKVLELTKNAESPYFGLPVVCVGHSNGASTLLAMCGAHAELAESLKSLVLFAPYADVRQASFLGKITHQGIRNTVPHFSGFGYDVSKLAPIDYIKKHKFPKGLPVFLVHALDDPHVRYQPNYTSLVAAFKGCGYGAQLHEHSFATGRHGSFSLAGNKRDRLALKDNLAKFIHRDVLQEDESAGDFSGMVPSDLVADEMVALGQQYSVRARLQASC